MKTINALFFALVVCAAGPSSAQQFVFHLSGDQEVPPVNSTASGGCYGELNQPASTFTITCVHDVVNATVMHIHRAGALENGPVAFDLGDPSSGFVTATWTGMTESDKADMLEAGLYVNIHTGGRPAGEIRGQILPRTVDTVAFALEGSQVVPPGETSGSGNCVADLNDGATALDISCTHTLPSPNAAHVHEAPVGENGPIVFTFPSPNSPLNGSVPMTPRLIADFAATFLYVDVHAGTTEEDSQAIRGQIGTPPEGAGTGTVFIRKLSYPSGGTSFEFTDTITNGTFTLNDPETRLFASVAPGTYTVTESDPSEGGWALVNVSCDDANSSGNLGTRTATINVEAGEVVRCTFENMQVSPSDKLFVFHMSGDQEVPPVVASERGGCMARFDAGASELTIVCTHNVDHPTLMHVHRGAPGSNGEVVFDLGPPDSPVIATWSGMTPAQMAELLAGNYYVNVHTAGRPSGAIRGQIVERTVDTVAFTLDSGQVVPPGSSPTTGSCTANLDDLAEQLAISCTHNLPSPDAAHVHQGERGTNGPVVFTFASPASPINENMAMTPRLVADFAGHLLYMDIHAGTGSEETETQIRGQIGTAPVTVTTGTIRIVKSTSPAGGTDFVFTDTVAGSPGTFTLDDGEMQTFSTVPAGTYTVTEGARSGWSLTDIVCTDGDSTGNPFSRTATVNLEAGETVTCTFRNLQAVASPTLFVFQLSGDQEVPPSGSTAQGGCFGQLDQTTRRFSLICTHNVDQAATMHVHQGAAGAIGPVVFDLGDPVSPVEATWNMTAAEMSQLLAGNYYVNIHAGGRPEGEIRGQILPRTVDSFSFTADGGQEVPPTDSTATGTCNANLADDAGSVFIECRHNADDITSTHLHAAPPGEDGPVVFEFSPTNYFSGNAPLTPRLVADFAAGFLYVNIHSTDYDTGEIRGNLFSTAAPVHLAGEVPTASEWALLILAAALGLVALRRVSS